VGLPEIGKRTAEQIVAELAGKAAAFAVTPVGGKAVSSRSTVEQTAVEGAMALGVPRGDAERLLDLARQSETKLDSAESLLREMLRLRTARS
jgi:Holliday junction resolvasome RuvABC DNA-binding subunit